MDGRLLDEIARAAVTNSCRRTLIKGGAGGVIGAALALLRGTGTGASRERCAPPPGKRCPSPEDSFCRATRQCVFSNCGLIGEVYNPCTCRCEAA